MKSKEQTSQPADAISLYHKEIVDIHKKSRNASEMSYRAPLQNLWNTLYGKSFPILHEGSSEQGTPDFTISNVHRHQVGFIECKDYGFDLVAAVENKKTFQREHSQLAKYLKLAPVVIFTDYERFLLVQRVEESRNGGRLEIIAEANLAANEHQKLAELFQKFVQAKPLPVKNQDAFIKLLAEKTQVLRNDILAACEQPNSYFATSEIHKLFSETIYKDLDIKDFADAFAQIVVFGLLFTRLTDKQDVSFETLSKIPRFIPLLRELLQRFEFADATEIHYILRSIIATINLYDEAMFYQGKSYKESHDREDPFIYMYENFLKAFDADTRNARGVFYTPVEVVNYIVRSIDEILKSRLGLPQGLRQQDVHILDFATGTGTFLLGAIEHIYSDLAKKRSEGLWQSQVREFILKNLYGFEYLVVPYVLAHFRIHQYLEDCDYKYAKGDRLKLYLTNTLDNSTPDTIPMFPELNTESAAACRVKNEAPILVIMGNPPYNNSSDPMNCRDWIMNLTKSYKDGLGEKKNNLNDDYIKFLRFAHWKMEKVERGVVGVITNNSFISGVTHRVMREKLMQTFDEIYVLDLHGNVNKAEKCPDGGVDANIFNIASAGVCITLFIKTGKPNNAHRGVYHQEIFGSQDEKKLALVPCSWESDAKAGAWQKLADDPKWHWFVPRNANIKYANDFIGLDDIFDNVNSGIKTDRDSLFIDIDKAVLTKRMQTLFAGDLSAEFVRDYNVHDSSSYDLTSRVKSHRYDASNVQNLHYRPFDFRHIYYNVGLTSRPAEKTMRHFIGHENIGLVFPRQVLGGYGFQHGFVSRNVIDVSLGGAKTGSETYFAPLYIYDNHNGSCNGSRSGLQNGSLGLESNKTPNWTAEFAKFLASYHSQTPEAVLAYIYAVLYSPSYRETYAEDLRYDYPRIPFTQDKKKFARLAALGQELIDLHSFKTAPKTSAGYPMTGNRQVDDIRYAGGKIHINGKQYFDGVSQSVWDYSIGGYQVLDKWLKSRKNRQLNNQEIAHFQQVCGVLAETISIQKQIDKVSGVW